HYFARLDCTEFIPLAAQSAGKSAFVAGITITMNTRFLSARDFSGSVQAVSGLSLTLQPLTDSHIDRVSTIERQAHTHPWTPSLFNDCLKGRQHCVLAFTGAQLVGYF